MRSAAQKAQVRQQAEKRWVKTARRRGYEPAGERETLAEYLERGGTITACEPVMDDPGAAIERVRKVRAELKFPKSPKNTRGEGQ